MAEAKEDQKAEAEEAPPAAAKSRAKKSSAAEEDSVKPDDTSAIDALEGLSRRELARLKSFVDRALNHNGEDSDIRGDGAVPDTVRLAAGVLPVNRAATGEITVEEAAKAAGIKSETVIGFNVRQAQPEDNQSTPDKDTGYGQKYLVVVEEDSTKHVIEL